MLLLSSKLDLQLLHLSNLSSFLPSHELLLNEYYDDFADMVPTDPNFRGARLATTLAPAGIVTFITSPENSRFIAGYPLSVWKELTPGLKHARDTGETVLVGPIEGANKTSVIVGIQAIERHPDVINNKLEPLWGYAISEIDVTKLLRKIWAERLSGHHYYFTAQTPLLDNHPVPLAGTATNMSDAEFNSSIARGQLSLTLMLSHNHTFKDEQDIQFTGFWFLSALASLVFAILVFNLIARPIELRKAVNQATSALKDSEERFRDFAETASDFFWSSDKDLNFDFLSENFETICCMEQNDFIGTPIQSLGNEIVSPQLTKSRQHTLASHQSFRDFTFVRLTKGEATVHLSLSGKPSFDADGHFSGYRGTGIDISAQVNSVSEMRKAKETAELASRSKTQFLANMSHELRTPLNAIIGFSELVVMQSFGKVEQPKYLEYADNINHSGKHLLSVIDEILDVSRIEVGALELNETEFDIRSLVKPCVTMIEARAEAREISSVLEFPQSNVSLYADETRMKQILINLLTNAVKFTNDNDKIVLAVSIREDGGVRFVVTDTGIGIAEQDQKKVFESFTQIQNVFSRSHQGVGLGLPLVKSLIELHDGTISLTSRVGQGTSVTIDLPAGRTRITDKANGEESDPALAI